jgi:putative Mg2+ transporter-C (MgtC) family protein
MNLGVDLQPAIVLLHLVAAVAAGGAIGIERSYHGRPAGFRTHTLVCLASSLLMLLAVMPFRWVPSPLSETIRLDPTRMAQGIATGIGFLGAGVIFKEGLTVRGLTTAASIWITSAIGTLIGVGLYFPAAAATVLTLGVLTIFRRLEMMIPVTVYAHHYVRVDRSSASSEDGLRAVLVDHGFKVSDPSYQLLEDGRTLEIRVTIRTSDRKNVTRLARTLAALEGVREFGISPAGD